MWYHRSALPHTSTVGGVRPWLIRPARTPTTRSRRPIRPRRPDTRSAGEPTHDPASSSTQPGSEPLPDAPLGYELIEEIGHGGMGIVYRGRDVALSRDVAVKLLQSRYALTSLARGGSLTRPRSRGNSSIRGFHPFTKSVNYRMVGRSW